MYEDNIQSIFPNTLDQAGGIPLRVQIREAVLAAIGRGAVGPAQRLPTMRAVATHLACDLNTVQRAYAELERAGVIETRRARGSFIATAPPPPDATLLATRLRDFCAATLARAQAEGLEPAAIVAQLRALIDS